MSAVSRFAFGVLLGAAAYAATAPDSTYKTLREAPVGDAFAVENIVLRRDAGVITLKSGAIAFTAPTMNRDTVAVFIGEGEFTLDPVMWIEKDYLKSITDQETIKDSFDRALFAFTDDTAKEIRGLAKNKSQETSRLADFLRDQRKRLRTPQAMENIEAAILADLYRAGQPGFFSAYIRGRKHNDLRFHVKPRGAMLRMSPEEVFAISVQPANVIDQLLYLSHLKSEFESGKASSDEDKRVVQAESYKIVTTIARNDHFTATTDLQFRALTGGDRVIFLELVPTLRVTRVTYDGQEIPFIQEDKRDDSDFSVVLPAPLQKDSQHHLAIEYQGDKVVHKAGGGNFSVGARESWYPNVNSFKDHARYDLTFKVPKQYTLVSVGKLAKEWTEEDLACSQWISDTPLAVAGFNYGNFKKKQVADPQSGMSVEGYANAVLPDYLKEIENASVVPTGTMSPSSLMERTMSEAQIATRIFNTFFGKSAFNRIAITQQPEFAFGQSWPNLVYLPLSAYLDSTQRWQLMGIQNRFTEFVEEVTAHEVAHQYWGHMVGWTSYHDQWLSEGFAHFSAGLFLQLTNKSPEKYLKYWSNARDRLVEKNSFGRRPNDAGPIWMGLRLMSEKNPTAYSHVVYGKGGYVLHMLRQMMHDPKEGDKYFIAMMQDFVAQHLNGNASTESFQRVVEKHMRPNMNLMGNGKMDWFFSQWVYGTAIPRYKLDYTVTSGAEGKFLVKGSVTQSEVPSDFVMIAPLYVDFDGQLFRMGAARITGSSTVPLEVQLPRKPKRVLLNAYHDVLEQQQQ
jgi:peptidase M1-like protein